MLDFGRFEALSFDCYGTLVDWETGILTALRPLLQRHGVACDDARLLVLYADIEARLERGPFHPYRRVLRDVVRDLGVALRFRPEADEIEALAESLPDWPPFPDTVEALRTLRPRFRLAIASNVDDDLFAGSSRHLGVTFDLVTTAQQLRSYKPAPAHLEVTLERLGLPPERLLHVAQSLYHDIAPARALGVATVRVNRASQRPGDGVAPPSAARPDLEVRDLKSLAALARDLPARR